MWVMTARLTSPFPSSPLPVRAASLLLPLFNVLPLHFSPFLCLFFCGCPFSSPPFLRACFFAHPPLSLDCYAIHLVPLHIQGHQSLPFYIHPFLPSCPHHPLSACMLSQQQQCVLSFPPTSLPGIFVLTPVMPQGERCTILPLSLFLHNWLSTLDMAWMKTHEQN